MGRSRKVVGLVAVGALAVLAACGSSNSSKSNETADTSSANTDSGDRERNVETSGWGDNGSGVANVQLQTATDTNVMTQIFHREGGEVFTTARIVRVQGEEVTSTIRIDGFSQEADAAGSHVLANFGTNGHIDVNVKLPGDRWTFVPTNWTMVSRDRLAVLFSATDPNDSSVAVIAYFDLKTGKLDTTIGNAGLTEIPSSLGMGVVNAMALRFVDAKNVPHFIVAGLTYGDGGSVKDVIVAGILPDGSTDTQIRGSGTTGSISLASQLPDPEKASVWNVALADPGASDVSTTIGVLLQVSQISDATTEASPGDSLRVVIASSSQGSQSIGSPEGMTGQDVPLAMSDVAVRNAVLDGKALVAHVSGTIDQGEFGSAVGQLIVTVSADHPDPSVIAIVPQDNIDFPGRGADDGYVTDLPIGKNSISVALYSNYKSMRRELQVCFTGQACAPALVTVLTLIDILESEISYMGIESLAVDASGVHVASWRHSKKEDTSTSGTLSFDLSGRPTVKSLVALTGPYRVDDSSTDENSRYVNKMWVNSAILLGGQRVVAVGSDDPNGNPTFLRTETAGSAPTDVKLVSPAGITGGYGWSEDETAALDDSSILMPVSYFDSKGLDTRLYKVKVGDGTTDSTFGTGGYVSVPNLGSESQPCDPTTEVRTGPGVFVHALFTYPLITVDGESSCSDKPSSIAWTTYTTAGKPIGSTTTISFDAAKDPSISQVAVDATGNLYALEMVAGATPEDGMHGRIVKFTTKGTVDPTFGVDGGFDLDWNVVGQIAWMSDARLQVDAAGRLYVADVVWSNGGDVTLTVVRLTTAGSLDVTTAPSATTTVAASETTVPPSTTEQPSSSSSDLLSCLLKKRFVGCLAAGDATAVRDSVSQSGSELTPRGSSQPSGLTVADNLAVLASVTIPPGDSRALAAVWVANAKTKVTATANPSGKSCTSDSGTCVIKGLDPSQAYTVTLSVEGSTQAGASMPGVAPIKPTASLKAGRSASVTSFVKPAAKAKATWNVRGGCNLNAANTKITAPKMAAICILSVTTPKVGSTPKTTRSVTIVVAK